MNIEISYLWSHKCPKKWDQYTLIALVITIVILTILAAVVINLSIGDNGVFNRAKTAKEQYQNADEQEQIDIAKTTNEIDSYIDGNRNETVSKADYDALLARVEGLEDRLNSVGQRYYNGRTTTVPAATSEVTNYVVASVNVPKGEYVVLCSLRIAEQITTTGFLQSNITVTNNTTGVFNSSQLCRSYSQSGGHLMFDTHTVVECNEDCTINLHAFNYLKADKDVIAKLTAIKIK